MWWIPTGQLTHFPLHAAGYHSRGSTKTVLDRVISSYSSSIKGLIYGRKHPTQTTIGPEPGDALIVAMSQTLVYL